MASWQERTSWQAGGSTRAGWPAERHPLGAWPVGWLVGGVTSWTATMVAPTGRKVVALLGRLAEAHRLAGRRDVRHIV